VAKTKRFHWLLLIAFSDLAASCQDRLFHNLFYPQAGEAVFEGLNTKSIARDSRSEKTRKVRRLVWLGLCLAAASAAAADDQALLRISGSYIAYSYDFNQLFGENVSGKGLFSLETASPDGKDAGQDSEIVDLLHRHGRAPISISRKKMLPCDNLSTLLLKKKIFIVCP